MQVYRYTHTLYRYLCIYMCAAVGVLCHRVYLASSQGQLYYGRSVYSATLLLPYLYTYQYTCIYIYTRAQCIILTSSATENANDCASPPTREGELRRGRFSMKLLLPHARARGYIMDIPSNDLIAIRRRQFCIAVTTDVRDA